MSAPAWVLALLARAQRDKLTGFLTFSLRHGDIRHVKVEQVHFAPAAGAEQCPRGCGQMESQEAGTMFRCPACGTKRTLAQITQTRDGT